MDGPFRVVGLTDGRDVVLRFLARGRSGEVEMGTATLPMSGLLAEVLRAATVVAHYCVEESLPRRALIGWLVSGPDRVGSSRLALTMSGSAAPQRCTLGDARLTTREKS